MSPPSFTDWLKTNWQGALAVLAVLLAGGATITVAIDSDGDGPNPPKEVTVKIPKAGSVPAGETKPTTEAEIPKALNDAVKRSEVAEHAGSRDETPAEAERVAPEQINQAREQQARIRKTQNALPTAGASAGFQGCVTRFVRNQSSRNGVRPQLQVLHYTVSPNRPGWSDVNSIVSYFNSGASQASSNFVIDREGNCAYIVPIEAKSWTQAAANPISISYEIINSGSEGTFMDTAGYNKLRSVMRQVSARTGIPMRRGAARGASVARTGIVHHKDFGIAGGGHVDITPYSIDQVVKIVSTGAVASTTRSKLTAYNRKVLDRRFYHWRGYHQTSGATKAKHLKYSGQWRNIAGKQKRRYDDAHARGQSWKTDGIGTQRLAMARTERFAKSDRTFLRR